MYFLMTALSSFLSDRDDNCSGRTKKSMSSREIPSRSPMRSVFMAACVTTLISHLEPAAATDQIDASTLKGKLILGYQGWFDCSNDGAGLDWRYWAPGGSLAAGILVDMLPDASELPAAERCLTSMKTADGRPVALFTDANPNTVERHFAWMREYKLDGVALQRFATGMLVPLVLKEDDVVLQNVRQGAEHSGRVFFVMYDLSGLKPADLAVVAGDWERLQRNGLTSSGAYLHHRGRPILGLWGLGFPGAITARDAESLFNAIDKASAPYGGVTYLGGVASAWHSRGPGASPDPYWDQVWKRLAVLSPWSVGRFADDIGADLYRRTITEPDMKATRALGIDYMPVVFPGFSWANARRARHQPAAAFNAIPRRCGLFYWRQVYNALSAGATMIYGAMFDELNEGTAMFKVLPSASQAPVQGTPEGSSFVTLDADGCGLPSDWYLRLAAAATSATHSHSRVSADLPLPLPFQ
jgi:hypothetical protein